MYAGINGQGSSNSNNGKSKKGRPTTIAFAVVCFLLSFYMIYSIANKIFFTTLNLPNPDKIPKPAFTPAHAKQCISENWIDNDIHQLDGFKTCIETCKKSQSEKPAPQLHRVCLDGCAKGTNSAFEISCNGGPSRDFKYCEKEFASRCSSECSNYKGVPPKQLIFPKCKSSCEEIMSAENDEARKENASKSFWGGMFSYAFFMLATLGGIAYIVNKYGMEQIIDRADVFKVRFIIFSEEHVLPLLKKSIRFTKKKVAELPNKFGAKTKTEKLV